MTCLIQNFLSQCANVGLKSDGRTDQFVDFL